MLMQVPFWYIYFDLSASTGMDQKGVSIQQVKHHANWNLNTKVTTIVLKVHNLALKLLVTLLKRKLHPKLGWKPHNQNLFFPLHFYVALIWRMSPKTYKSLYFVYKRLNW